MTNVAAKRFRQNSMNAVVCCVALAMLTLSRSLDAADFAVQHFNTPDGVEYGTWGPDSAEPSPTLFVLAGDIDGTLGKRYFRQCGNELAEDGWLCVSIDIPCHGKQTKGGIASGLSGWSQRASRGEDFVAECNARLSSVLDHLIETGVTDPTRVAVCGTSRGGFLAIHFAAHDARVACAAGFAPVTDLGALSEFSAIKDDPFVEQLSLSTQAERLAGRAVWVVIGDQDARVGTNRAIEFAQAITAASRKNDFASRVELHIMPEPRGHTTPRGSSQRAAEWIRQQTQAAAMKSQAIRVRK